MEERKQYHIITVGNSLISNYKKENNISDKDTSKIPDEALFQYMLSYNKKASAEINSFLTFIEKNKVEPQLCKVYFIGTDTDENKKVLSVLPQYFKEVIKVKEVIKGKIVPPTKAPEEECINGLKQLLDYELRQVFKRQQEGYEVYFCASGGYKPHVIFTALAGYFSNCEIYYINEEANVLITLPPILLTLNSTEQDIIRKLYNREDYHIVLNESIENTNWFNNNREEIEKLEKFEFINIIREKETNKPIKISLTNKCKLYIEKHLKR